jgi:glycosyltransferase involved in cell wall biosynthesis
VPSPRSLASIYSRESRRRLTKLLEKTRPDLAHVHNVFERLSTSVLDALHAAHIPTVMTLHDYKLVCPNYRMLTHDGICQRCVGAGQFWYAARHRCLDGLFLPSMIVAAEAYLNRWRGVYAGVRRFIAPSQFLKQVMVSAGMPPDRIAVVPNAVPAAEHPRRLPATPPEFVSFGRFSEEKGLDVLLDATKHLVTGARVILYGEGPLDAELRRRVEEERLPVAIRGFAPREVIFNALERSLAAVSTAIWHENCSMSILEAGSRAVATVGTSLGGTPELISSGKDGILVPPRDAHALANAMNHLAAEPGLALRLGQRSWARVRRQHSLDDHVASLMDTYNEAISIAPDT